MPDGFFAFFGQLFTLGAMTLYGGVLGIFIGCSIYVLVKRQSLLTILDLAAPIGFLSVGIGRIGCFLNGDDYGIPMADLGYTTQQWWGVTFPYHHSLVQRVPVQLVEAVAVFLLAFIGFWLRPAIAYAWGKGVLGYLVLSLYGVIRFFLEYLRGDPRGWVIPGTLSPAQAGSVLLLAVSIPLLIFLARRKLKENRLSVEVEDEKTTKLLIDLQ